MTESRSDKSFDENIRSHLEQRVSDIDDETLSALRRIRHRALSETAEQPWSFASLLKPVPLATSLCFALLLSITVNMNMFYQPAPAPALEDIPLLTAKDDIELYRDLDFYQWLEAHKANG